MYEDIIGRFNQFHILVIGDAMLDVYLKGASNRISPEAPVPVVDVLTKHVVLGGAANTALNLSRLGAKVSLCSIIGKDEYGERAISLLTEAGIGSLIVECESRSTLVKTRVMADDQLLLRYDSGSEEEIDPNAEAAFILLLEQYWATFDGILISDYKKGLLTEGIISTLERLSAKNKKLLAVDSKHLNAFRRLRPFFVKPNYREAMQLLGKKELYAGRVEQIQAAGKELFAQTQAGITIVTLDAEGAVLFDCFQQVYRSHAYPVTPGCVSGAGDAYTSAFLLSCLAGGDIPVAAEISAAVAAVAVSKQITACCTMDELKTYLSINNKYIADMQHLKNICSIYRSQGKKIVFTNGCFDILHSGHVNYLNKARELGDVLIVGINTDESIKRIKGNGRPINQLQERVDVLSGLGAVNHIVSFGAENEDTPLALIEIVKPDIFAKGGDYTREALPEAKLIETLGGEVVLLPFVKGRSTSGIINQIFTNGMK